MFKKIGKIIALLLIAAISVTGLAIGFKEQRVEAAVGGVEQKDAGHSGWHTWGFSYMTYSVDNATEEYISNVEYEKKVTFKYKTYKNVTDFAELFQKSGEEFYYTPITYNELSLSDIDEKIEKMEDDALSWNTMSKEDKTELVERWFAYLPKNIRDKYITGDWPTDKIDELKEDKEILTGATFLRTSTTALIGTNDDGVETGFFVFPENYKDTYDIYYLQADSSTPLDRSLLQGYKLTKINLPFNEVFDIINENITDSSEKITEGDVLSNSEVESTQKIPFESFEQFNFYSFNSSDGTFREKINNYNYMQTPPLEVEITAPSVFTKDEENYKLISEQTLIGNSTCYGGVSSAWSMITYPQFTFVYEKDAPSTGSLKISKTITDISTYGYKCEFTIELSDNTINGKYGDVTFENGVGKCELTPNGRVYDSITINELPAGTTYRITENVEKFNRVHSRIADSQNAEGEIKENTEIEVLFNNEFLEFELVPFVKFIKGNAADKDKSYNFKIDLNNDDFNGEFGGIVYENGVGYFSIKGIDLNNREVKNALPVARDWSIFVPAFDRSYAQNHLITITELDDDATSKVYYTSYDEHGEDGTNLKELPDKSYTLPPFSSYVNMAYSIFINEAEQTYNLTLNKKVTGNAKDSTKAFPFDIYLYNESLEDNTLTYGGVTFKKTGDYYTGTVSLKDGENITISDLPANTYYAINETNGEYDVEVVKTDANEQNDSVFKDIEYKTTGIMTDDNNVTFVNNLDKYGNVVISKELTGNDIDVAKEFEFNIEVSDNLSGKYGDVTLTNGKGTFKLKSGQAVKVENLPYNTSYKVTEKDSEGYTSSSVMSEGIIGDDIPDTVKFVNNRDTYGNLIIKKTASGNTIEDKTYKFKVTLGNENATYSGVDFKNGIAEIELKANEEKKIEGIPNNVRYVVEELDTTDYIVTAKNDAGKIKGNDSVTATFNNHKDTYGAISIAKTTSGNTIDKDAIYKIEVTADGLKDGKYSNVEFKDGKAIVEIRDNETKVIGNLPNGLKYSVKEIEADDYDVTYTGETGTVVGKETKNVTINNHKDTFGNLSIEKTVSGNTIEDKTFKFDITLGNENATYSDVKFVDGKASIELKAGETKLLENIPNGLPYTIKEVDADDYDISYEHYLGNIKGNETIYAKVNNNKDTFGAISLKKTVSGNAIIEDAKYTFKITAIDSPEEAFTGTYSGVEFNEGVGYVTLKADEEKIIEGLPNGLAYTIIEENADSEVSYMAEGTNVAVYDEEVKGIIVGDSTDSIIANNNRDTFGKLSIKKTVSGDGINDDDTYAVAITAPGLTGTYSDVEFANGFATIELKANEEKIIEGIPNNTKYSIVENTNENFVVTYENDEGTIQGDKTASVTINNHRDKTPVEPIPSNEIIPPIYQPVDNYEPTVTETPIPTTPTDTGDNFNNIYIFIAIAAAITASGVIINRVRKTNR